MNKKVIEQLAKIANVQVNELTNALEDEASELEINIVKTFTQSELEEYESNTGKERDREYNKGKEVGLNQAVRDEKESRGLSFEGKDFKTLLDSIEEKALKEAGINIDEKVSLVKKDLEILRKTTSTDIESLSKERDAIKGKYDGLLNNQEISKHIPDNLKGVTKKDAMTILKSNYEFTTDDEGNKVVKQDGEVLKNKARSPLTWENVIKDNLIERDWTLKSDGRGDKGGKGLSNKFSKMSELESHMESQGINSKSKEARVLINEAAKDNPEFDFVS